MTKRVRVTSGVTQTKLVIIIIIIYANSVNCDLALAGNSQTFVKPSVNLCNISRNVPGGPRPDSSMRFSARAHPPAFMHFSLAPLSSIV